MSFRTIELTTVDCDCCGRRGPSYLSPETAEGEASLQTGISRLRTAGRHACKECRSEIAKGEAKR